MVNQDTTKRDQLQRTEVQARVTASTAVEQHHHTQWIAQLRMLNAPSVVKMDTSKSS